MLLSSSFAILFISCDLVLLILIKISNILCYDCHQGVNWQCEILLIQMFNHPRSSSGWEAGWSRQPISRYIDCCCRAWYKHTQSHTMGERLAFWNRSYLVALNKTCMSFVQCLKVGHLLKYDTIEPQSYYFCRIKANNKRINLYS